MVDNEDDDDVVEMISFVVLLITDFSDDNEGDLELFVINGLLIVVVM